MNKNENLNIRMCLYVDSKHIADFTGIWLYDDYPEINLRITLSIYYDGRDLFDPQPDYFVLKSKFGDRITQYLIFESDWIIQDVREIREGGKPKLVIKLDKDLNNT